jgi:malonate decarboxylase alpha subunit
MHDLIRPGDRVALEGDNQKQADFLSRTRADCDPQRINKLHMLISSVSRPEHLDLFERGIAAKLDLAYAGPQSVRADGRGRHRTNRCNPHLRRVVARMFVDLALDVVLLCAEKADRDGNLYTGPDTEDTPTIAEAAASHDGVVIVQADEIVDGSDDLPRVDIPAAGSTTSSPPTGRSFLQPLFTRDPRHIGPVEILKAMIVSAASTNATRWSRSTTASGSTPPQSNCCCRHTAKRSA